MNFANYSPYNKSYKFICFQNQAYHEKNKRTASPCVKSNIRYSLGKLPSNPQNSFSERISYSSQNIRSRESSPQKLVNMRMSNSMMRSSSTGSAMLQKEKKVVHKNLSYEKFRSKRVSQQNAEMVSRLLKASCQVTQKKDTEKSFKNHLKYKDIRKKYNDGGVRRQKMALGNQSLLCPTLSEYNKSGLAQKFVELDLSMSMTPSSPTRSFRKRLTNLQTNIKNGDDLSKDI